MEYVTMGRSGLKVSRACLGTMNFGTASGLAACDESEARTIIDAFLAAGGNFIDTADVYSGGEAEQIVGRALRRRRDEVVIATKAFMPRGPGPNDRGLSRLHLSRALDASLRRLGTDYIDLYYCHQWDAETPIAETMAALDGFVRAGKVRYLGCSNFTAAQIVESQPAARRWAGRLLNDRNLVIAEEVAGVAAQLSASATSVALAWTAAQPAITSVIIGPRSQDQLQQNLAGFSLDLPAQALAHLTTISDPAEGLVTGSVL